MTAQTAVSTVQPFKEKKLEEDNKSMRDLVAKLNQKLKEREGEVKVLKQKLDEKMDAGQI